MERTISMESWEDVQRHGQEIADKFNSLAQGIGCMLQSHILPTSVSLNTRQGGNIRQQQQQVGWGSMRVNLPWPFSNNPTGVASVEIHKPPVPAQQTMEISSAFYDLGHRIGRVGADLGACVGGFVGQAMSRFHGVGNITVQKSHTIPVSAEETQMGRTNGTLEWRDKDDNSLTGIVLTSWQSKSSRQRQRTDEESSSSNVPVAVSEPASAAASQPPASYESSNEELVAAISKSANQFHKQSSISVTTTYDSRTQDIESSVVARGDLWRAEASHGGASSSSGSSPLFLVQIGPILFVRDTTLLLPIHLSKRHLLWYGFDRKNGLHSLCPAIWSKHRRWLFMSMVCLNPVTCSFMDLQFPNGQMTYVAGEGVSGSAFLPVYGGLLQVQGRHPGDSKLSFSFKNRLGTTVCPSLHLPEKSLSVGVTQPLAWQRSGVMLRPTIQLSVTPTFGGRNPGWRAEVVHSPRDKLSVACGCSYTLEPFAFASISVGRSKRNGEHTGSSGLVLQVETPLENPRRTSFSLQLNSGVEF